jgi:hypothetical protein
LWPPVFPPASRMPACSRIVGRLQPILASCLGNIQLVASQGLAPSKMGNRHLRKLLVVGAHAALYSMKSGKTRTAMADWARSLLAKKPCVDALVSARRIFGLIQRVVRAAMCAASHAAHRPQARMGVRGSGPSQSHVLAAPVDKLVFLIPSR